jgi:hypothetical protein
MGGFYEAHRIHKVHRSSDQYVQPEAGSKSITIILCSSNMGA